MPYDTNEKILKALLSGFFGGATRIRTGDKGFADPCLTTWPWRHILLVTNADANDIRTRIVLERITGLEPATFALARRRSTK